MVTVLRLGHRRGRDDRISTHVGLTARQFGADQIIYAGERDENMLDSLQDVVDRWGGPFNVSYTEAWRPVIDGFDGTVAHLTMYGTDYRDELPRLEETVEDGDLLIIVGGERVPSDVFDMADYNLAIGHQPHSEVAALAVFLHDLYGGAELDASYADADIEAVPTEDGKETREPV
ncbi:MAG: tRNA (cytidine(56)-2'-O)-methyltransferase [Candidatus Nanohaloarchaea archaeon]